MYFSKLGGLLKKLQSGACLNTWNQRKMKHNLSEPLRFSNGNYKTIFVSLAVYNLKQQEKPQINNPVVYLKLL